MKLLAVLSLFTGWFGAGMVYYAYQSVWGAILGWLLFLVVTVAHDPLIRH